MPASLFSGDRMRAFLQRLYLGCGVLAGASLILLCGFVIYSVLPGVGLWLQDLFCGKTGFMGGAACFGNVFNYVPQSADDFAGYAMLASSFLALAHTFGRGEHVRVTILIQRLHGRARRWAELWCLTAGTMLSGFLAWYCVKLMLDSRAFGDMSTGLIAIPLWIPQIFMAVGACVLFIAMLEQLIVVAAGGSLPEEKASLHMER